MFRKPTFTVTLLFVWVSATFVLFFVLATRNLVPFDPAQSLLLSSMDAGFDQRVKAVFENSGQPVNSSVFHIQAQGCACNNVSQSHIRSLNQNLQRNDYQIRNVSPDNVAQLSAIIPSAPAIVVFDQQGKLSYLGPYSSGLLCGSRNSLIDSIIDKIVTNKHLGATIISQSEGCYCALKA
ncbi:DUF6436 domain-containing protein [Aliiglaciecola sp. LCG003]|uniref:DUF6436 domain-containing protein n=1 Tax=Aliiglaciecola sp. LCG003 TaxID=3053655 RepID=UPI0025722298|nr:DUF6436 domain-containing protein [Aliiglaciecola sp. LCG003]WJG09760.1 DUF6436 domain-containing protein [Aliiglaciecola sp. LCG003]